jgi:pimeloyl-ACP methyl ester carboxylesterase
MNRRFSFDHILCSLVLVLGACALISPAVGLGQSTGAEASKRLPPEGIALPEKQIAELTDLTKELRRLINVAVAKSPDADSWRPDVEVFVRAVELALEQNLFYRPKDADAAIRVLQVGLKRLDAVAAGTRGLELLAIGTGGNGNARTLVGGFVSEIDGSIQPYGLVIPRVPLEIEKTKYRLDVWLHGRGDTSTEVPFLLERLDRIGEYAPPGVIVLHPFGRHCNAFKFAGEVDVYEALAHVQDTLPIDPKRISIRGFSMGGAGCWHLAAHDPARWFAANPGAGFVDTVKYQGWDKGFPYEPHAWGRKLLNWYDVPPWVDNLANTRVIAYSGEVDKQRAAAETMVQAAKASPALRDMGYEITHVIGRGMAHKIDSTSSTLIDAQLAAWEREVDKEPRKKIRLVTHTLRYHKADWLLIEGMEEHWRPAIVEAELMDSAKIEITTENVTAIQLNFTEGGWPLKPGYLDVLIDGQSIDGPAVLTGKPVVMSLSKVDGEWLEGELDALTPRKRPRLQGPIDDAFMSSFLFVLPSRPCRHGVVQRFVDREWEHARKTWRLIMRGEDRFVTDTDLTPELIASNNLICFGDFTSNRYLASIASALPITWTDDKILVGEQKFDPAKHAAVLIYPNPQAPNRYVVVNSGITFREFSNKTNSRQIAMLPDWAILDVSQESDEIFPGRVVAGGLFDESWKLKSPE